MHIVITGASGTVGSVLSQHLKELGHQVSPWNRTDVPIDNYHRMEHYLRAVRPDVLFHLAVASKPTGMPNESWMVTYEWASELAWITKILDIKFIYISTVKVFSDEKQGPFTVDSIPDAQDGYGAEKRQAETHVRYQNPNSSIVRLGWQIGDGLGSNNMVDYLYKQMEEHGEIRASSRWLPACSFLADTAKGLAEIMERKGGDLYMLDSNEGWQFDQIVSALNEKHGNTWKVIATEDFVYDQRMIDLKVQLPALKDSFLSNIKP